MKRARRASRRRAGAAPTLISPALLRRWPLPRPDGETGKDGRGAVLIVGGSQEIPGAVILAAVAALRAGAGKLRVATGRGVAPLVAVTVPEARVTGLRQGAGGELHDAACRVLREDVARCDALLIGPGMAPSAAGAAADLIRSCLAARARSSIPSSAPSSSPSLILDAGALGTFEGRNAFARARGVSVIATPHAGEMARVWGISREKVLADPAAIAARAADQLGVIVVLKGARTFVATPDGQVFRHEAGNVGLATSGSGDALSGIIAGLCARGATPVQAAAWGVFLHGKAGEALARKHGTLGFLARELSAEVPALMARLGGG